VQHLLQAIRARLTVWLERQARLFQVLPRSLAVALVAVAVVAALVAAVAVLVAAAI
jgi:hypothetical protein